MTLRLKRKESAVEGLLRIAREEFAVVEAGLHATDDRAEAIHDIRKHLKIVRALYRFWRDSIPAEDRSRENAALRDLARDFSAARDLEVKLAALRSLSGDGTEAILQQWALERDRLTEEVYRPENVQKHLDTLDAARHRFATLPDSPGGWKLLSQAFTRAYRHTRKAFADSFATPADDHLLHEWRKRAKVLEYQVTMLQRMHRRAEKLADQLHRLTEALGEEHDLVALSIRLQRDHADFLETLPGRHLLGEIASRRTEFRRRSVELADRLLGVKSSVFVARLRRWWRSWR